MPTYENMYYYLEHSIREALQDLEQQNFGAAKKTLTQAREVTEKMRRVIVGKNDVYECFRNPYDFIERYQRFRSRIIRTAPQSSENAQHTLSRSITVTRPMCARVTSWFRFLPMDFSSFSTSFRPSMTTTCFPRQQAVT